MRRNTSIVTLGSNVDLMPTVLGLAGVRTPSTMDGRSVVAELVTDLARCARICTCVRVRALVGLFFHFHLPLCPHSAPAPTRQRLLAALAERPSGARWRTELLIEYYGLGDVVRCVQTLHRVIYNTFAATQRGGISRLCCSYEHLEDTDNNTFRTLRILDPSAPAGSPLRNAKYSEFVGRDDWDHKHGPLECELFNLDADPWEMNNT